MKELHTFGWYAARISPLLPKEAFKPVPSRLLGGLAYLVVTLSAIIVIGVTDLPFWLNTMLAIVIGSGFAGMSFLGHEILHGTVVRNPILKDFFGGMAFWSFCIGPKLWRKWHNLTHHVHTQHRDKDPDTWSHADSIQESPLKRLFFVLPKFVRNTIYFFFLMINFTFHSTNMFFKFIKEFNPKKQPVVTLEFLLPTISWIGLLLAIGFEKWIFAYIIPMLIANFILSSYIATNHNLNPQTDINDPLANSLSVTVPKFIDVLHFNFSYHTEHHIFPGMNPKFYPMVKKKILEMWPERYHEMPMEKAMIALFITPRVYYTKEELIDMQLGDVYDSLGTGLDPNHIISKRKEDLTEVSINKEVSKN
ncbi:acyl-CoA desaturase [Bacillus sp. 31A1R]|uniref:Acyl-CoA desaturase n=1 Tax=Robertmurraya mangrovi TaxID=3098077 RepID=A0ABU5J2T1_9BACI|nr:acyl-CoA desaturase [Bacillus sp. 31A1R]MDZ5473727.1 acyl-CoA desaturase [Bacillus sp. 31A1R]